MHDFGRSLLILGGARSGKSRHGQALAEAIGGRLVYIATAQAFDAEMVDRIARHRADRDERWRTIEAPFDLADTIAGVDDAGTVALVDCLTLWTSNLILADRDVESAAGALCDRISRSRCRIVLVANEVGLGIVPDNALARRFRDAAGLLNQMVAKSCDSVDVVFAGLPMRLKQNAPAAPA